LTDTKESTVNTLSQIIRRVLLAGASAALAATAQGAQPPDVVPSDSGSDTAMGSEALSSLTTGYQNTASGAGALQLNQTGYKNTATGYAALANSNGNNNAAFGSGALVLNQNASDNSAFGMDALYNNKTGNGNTAAGSHALFANTGSYNTAVGLDALYYNTGSYNTGMGFTALNNNATGTQNSAFGWGAMGQGTTGSYNTAVGGLALLWNTGDGNTALGNSALAQNRLGSNNAASGYYALASNTTGNSNTALGYYSLYANTIGGENVAIGQNALGSNVSGGNNIAIGTMSGYDITGVNNIDIGSMGASGENGIIRIGTPATHTKVFIAGIESTKITGNAVYVTASGELGVLASSERYKTAITPMDVSDEKIARLRPVTFHLKSDPGGAVQYGLIAEEVNKLYPELVIHDQAGQIQGVRYDELAPMLLNVVQRQQRRIHVAETVLAAQASDLRALKTQLADLTKRTDSLQAASVQPAAERARLAQR
jgi:hypothetical protein